MQFLELENLLIYCQVLNLNELTKIIAIFKANQQGTETITETMRRLAIAKATAKAGK